MADMNSSKLKMALAVCTALMMLFMMSGCGLFDDDDMDNVGTSGVALDQPITDGKSPADEDVAANEAEDPAETEDPADTDNPAGLVRPEGWFEETHGNSATPNYDVVFAGDKVHRIDLIIPSETWDAMLANMTELFGEFGSGGGPDGWHGGGCDVNPSENDNVPSGGCGYAIFPGMASFDDCGNKVRTERGTANECESSKGSEGAQGTVARGEMPVSPGAGMPPMWPDGWEPPEGWEPPSGGMPPEFNVENPDWFPCTVSYNGYTWTHVGMRFKGNSSLMFSWHNGILKLPFRFNFDKFEDDYPEIDNQRFYGFKKLSFSSNWSDDSLLREKLVADIFRYAGVPAPRTAFYQVYIDHGDGPEYIGLYTMVELPDKPMLDSQFSGKGGNLYKPEGNGATFSAFKEASFDKETNVDEADFSDVKALYDALHADRTDAAKWRENLEKVFDVDGFVKWLAVNTLIQNWDTYGRMTHNYYLYNDPGDGHLHWIPWDNNMALDPTSAFGGGPLSLYLTTAEVGEEWPLIRYLMDDDVYWRRYVSYVEETKIDAFWPQRMKEIYAAAHDLIKPYVLDEDGKIIETYTLLDSAQSFESSVDTLNKHVDSRYAAALQFLSDNP